MDDPQPDKLRVLDTEEAQMRRALGLTQTPERPHPAASVPESHPHRRKFVRDGEVPVTVVRHGNVEAKDQLEGARIAMRALAAAKERAERLLAEAQMQLRDLQTKLGHERLSRDEAVQRAQADRAVSQQALQTLQAELSAEKIARERVEQALREARQKVGDLTEKLHAVQQGQPRPVARATSADRPRKPPAKRVVERPAKQRAAKPVKWWLGER